MNGASKLARSVFGKREKYVLQFNHEEDGLWYVDFPNWPFDHHNLLMVAGADELCAYLSDDDKIARVEVVPSNEERDMPGWVKLVQTEHSMTGGSTYEVHNLEGFERDIWLCPVTLFVLGKYPKFMYIRKQGPKVTEKVTENGN